MEWFAIAAVAVGVIAVIWTFFRGNDQTVPAGDRIGEDQLASFLTDAEIDLGSTQNPDPEILRPHIAADDELIGAVEARSGNKRAYLVVLGDRLVVGEATVGSMGAAVHSIPFHQITSFNQGYDVGGTFEVSAGETQFTFTHVPRSKTRDFAGLLRNRIGGTA